MSSKQINAAFEKIHLLLDVYTESQDHRSIEDDFLKNIKHWNVLSNRIIRKFSNEYSSRRTSFSSSNITILTSKIIRFILKISKLNNYKFEKFHFGLVFTYIFQFVLKRKKFTFFFVIFNF
jgi:hypothetical protein